MPGLRYSTLKDRVGVWAGLVVLEGVVWVLALQAKSSGVLRGAGGEILVVESWWCGQQSLCNQQLTACFLCCHSPLISVFSQGP